MSHPIKIAFAATLLALAVTPPGSTTLYVPLDPIDYPYCWQPVYNPDGSYRACCHHEWRTNPDGSQSLIEGPLGCDTSISESSCPDSC